MNHVDENMANALDSFSEELASIRSPYTREYVLAAFSRFTPEHFWVIPASTTGRFHPPQAREKFGLCWHVRHTIWWAKKLMVRWSLDNSNGHAADIVIASLLLHDLWKNGSEPLTKIETADRDIYGHRVYRWPKGPEGITGTHGILLAEAMSELVSLPCHYSGPIRYCIAEHMGKWTNPDRRWTYPDKDWLKLLVETVQLADYCAANAVKI